MPWLQVHVHTDPAQAERIEEALTDLGATSVALEDAGDTPLLEPEPGTMPLWHATRVVALFADDVAREAIADTIAGIDADGGLTPQFETVPERDWSRVWMDDWEPLQFGRRLWVAPLETELAAPEAVIVRLDPGLAFGTGTHATTALCLEWLDGLELADCHVLDHGCGSGILAIAALRLGAATATAVDIDPQALEATQANAATNAVSERLITAEADGAGTAPGPGRYAVIVANIVAGPLIQAAAELAPWQQRGDRIALAGVLSEQAEAVRAAYAPYYAIEVGAERDGWVRLEGTRR